MSVLTWSTDLGYDESKVLSNSLTWHRDTQREREKESSSAAGSDHRLLIGGNRFTPPGRNTSDSTQVKSATSPILLYVKHQHSLTLNCLRSRNSPTSASKHPHTQMRHLFCLSEISSCSLQSSRKTGSISNSLPNSVPALLPPEALHPPAAAIPFRLHLLDPSVNLNRALHPPLSLP